MIVKELDFDDPRALSRWDAYAQKHGELYHLSRWGAVLRRAFSFTPLYLYGEEKGELVSLLPLLLVRRPFGGLQVVSVPHLEAGGVVPGPSFAPYLDYLLRRVGKCELLLLQYREALPEFPCSCGEVILVKALPATTEGILPSIPSANARNCVRQSLRLSYQVEIGNSVELREVFYRLYLEKMREFGTPPQAGRFFAAIAEGFGPQCAVIALKGPNHVWVAASLVVGSGATLNSLAFVASAEMLRQKAGYALEYRVLEYAVQHGYRSLVLGRSEEGRGNYHYKKSLGGVPVPLFRYRLRLDGSGVSPLETASVKSRYRSLAGFWSRLPAPVTDHLGPILRKWLY